MSGMGEPVLRQLLLVHKIKNQFLGFGIILKSNVSKLDPPEQSCILMCPNLNHSWSLEPTILPRGVQIGPCLTSLVLSARPMRMECISWTSAARQSCSLSSDSDASMADSLN